MLLFQATGLYYIAADNLPGCEGSEEPGAQVGLPPASPGIYPAAYSL